MDSPPDRGVNIWQQSRTSVGTRTIGAGTAFFIGTFDVSRGVFATMNGVQPEQRDRDVTWLGNHASLYVAMDVALPANGVYIGWYSRFPWGATFEYTSDEAFLGVGITNGAVKGFIKTPIVHPYITNVTLNPVSVAWCFRIATCSNT